MIDRTTPLQVPGRIADRQAEARARRFAAEAATSGDHTFWMTDRLRAVATTGGSIVEKVRGLRLRGGSTVAPARFRP
jgi:hypothetical protein